MNWGKIWQVVRKPDNIFFIATILISFIAVLLNIIVGGNISIYS